MHTYHIYTSVYLYSETWELGTPEGLSKTVLNSNVLFFSQVHFYVVNRLRD